jgi:methionine-rich copper-binding protein CopC
MMSVRKSFGLLATLSLLVVLATPAGAHTKVDKTTPGEGDSVSAGNITLAVSFTDKVLDLADSSELVLKGDGDSVSGVGCLTVTERGIKAEAFVGTPGDYKVSWRTVAEDGHPIDGTFAFTVTGTSDGESLTCKEGVTVTIPKESEPVVIAPSPNEENTDTAAIYNYLIGGGLVAVAVAIVVILRRRKTTK